MADIRLSKVPSGTNQTIACTPDSRFVFDFSTDEATMTRSGDNLVFTFDDGGSVELTGFYTTYNSEEMPDFEVDGTTISGADFFTAMNEPDLMPAAGPAMVTVADGARYHEYANSSLLGGIDHLGGLDLGFDRAEEPENDLYGLGMDGGNAPLSAENYGGNIPSVEPEPSVPGNPDDVPTIDHNPTEPDPIDPTNPDSPDPSAIQPGLGADGGRIIVDEAALNKGTGGTGDTDHGALGTGGFNVNLHGEGGVITIGGENGYTITVDADGNVTGFADATSGNGLTVNGVKVTVEQGDLEYKDGVLTVKYGYELSGSLTHGEAGKVGADDTLSGTISIGVVDGTGDVANGSITVEVHDDGPRIAVTDNYKASVNFGADDGTGDAGTGALAVEAFVQGSTEALEWSGHGTDLNHMTVNESWTSGNVTVTRTDAGYEFKTSQDGATNLTVRATDADGDTNTANVLVTKPVITSEDPNNPPVNPDPDTHPQAPVASIVVDEGVQPEHGGNGHELGTEQHSGSFKVDLNGETENCKIQIGEGGNSVEITFDTNGNPVLPTGVVTSNGLQIKVTEVTENTDGGWTVKYSYKLDGNQTHKDSSDRPVDTLHDDINITVTDASGDTSEGLIHVEVHDDVPTMTLVQSNSVSVSMGADNGDAATVVAAKDADGTEVYAWTNTQGGSDTTTDLTNMQDGDIWYSADGSMTVTKTATGYEFSLAEDKSEQTIHVIATDTDKDTANQEVTLTPPTITPPDPVHPDPKPDDPTHIPSTGAAHIVVDEGALSDGSGQHTEHGISGTGAFTVDVHGEHGGSIVLTGDNSTSVTLNIPTDDASSITVPQGSTLTMNGVAVTITGAQLVDGEWKVSYEYELTEHQTHGASGKPTDKVLSGDIKITVTDGTGDVTTGNLTVEVHDDTPALEVVSNEPVEIIGTSTSLNFVMGKDEVVGGKSGNGWQSFVDKGWEDGPEAGPWNDRDPDGTHSESGDGFQWGFQNGYKIIATFVRYTYAENGSIAVDSLEDTGSSIGGEDNKTLWMTENGLGMGNGKRTDGWSEDDTYEISTNPNENNMNSEAIVLEPKNGTVNYGLDITFGNFDDADRAIICFYLTPQNNNDNTLVLMREVTFADLADGKISIDVPAGYTKAIIAPIKGEHGENSSFTIKQIDVNKPAWEQSGEVVVTSGADGVDDAVAWDWSSVKKQLDGQEVKISDALGAGTYTVTVTIDEATGEVVATLSGGTVSDFSLNGATLFHGTLDGNNWNIQQFYRYTVDGEEPKFEVDFLVTDKDGTESSAKLPVDMSQTESIDRFDNVILDTMTDMNAQYDDQASLLAGESTQNDLMYGRSGNDLMFGDGGNESAQQLLDVLGLRNVNIADDLKLGSNGRIWKALNDARGTDDEGSRLEALLGRLEELQGEGGDDALFGGLDDDMLFGGGGNDYLVGNGLNSGTPVKTDHDMLFGGAGNDIIMYDSKDFIIHGGSGTDILLAGKDAGSLDTMLKKDSHKTYVSSIEVLIKSLDTTRVENLGITNHDTLSAIYGIVIGVDGAMELSSAWKSVEAPDGYQWFESTQNGHNIRVETTSDVEVTVNPPKTDSHAETGAENTAHFDDASVLSASGYEGVDADSTDSLNDMSDQVDAPVTDTPKFPASVMKLAAGPRMFTKDDAEEPKPEGTDGDDSLMGTDGDELLFGLGGNDYLFGGEGRDSLYGGDGDDLIVYDPTDYLVQGGDGIDFLLSGNDEELHLQDLLNNNDPNKGPLVSDVEVLLKGNAIDGLTSLGDLKDYGITVEDDKLSLSGDWSGSEGKYTYNGEDGKSFTLETTLTGREQQDGSITFTHDSASDQADQELMQAITNMQADTGGC